MNGFLPSDASSDFLAHAVRNIDMAVADFILLVTQCKTTDEALTLRAFVEPLILKLEAVESACRHRADELSGASR